MSTKSSASPPTTTTARPALVATARSWPRRRRSASPAEARLRFPASGRVLPARGRDPARATSTSRLLRQAVAEVRAPARDLPRVRARRLPLVPEGHAALAQAEAVDAARSSAEQLGSGEVLFTEHHESHAASAFFPSPFERAAILTIDGVGEWATAARRRRGQPDRILKELHFPHSLGLLYSAFTYFTGFKVNTGEYKVMGLAPYGDGAADTSRLPYQAKTCACAAESSRMGIGARIVTKPADDLVKRVMLIRQSCAYFGSLCPRGDEMIKASEHGHRTLAINHDLSLLTSKMRSA